MRANYDPFGSMQGFNQQFQNFMSNPMQYFASKKLNIPVEYQNNPQGAVQYLLNNGTMTQEQLSQLQNVAKRIESNTGFLFHRH